MAILSVFFHNIYRLFFNRMQPYDAVSSESIVEISFCESGAQCNPAAVAAARPAAAVINAREEPRVGLKKLSRCNHVICKLCINQQLEAGKLTRPRLGAEWDEAVGAVVEADAAKAGGQRVPLPKTLLSYYHFPKIPEPPLDNSVDPYDFWPILNTMRCPVGDCTTCMDESAFSSTYATAKCDESM